KPSRTKLVPTDRFKHRGDVISGGWNVPLPLPSKIVNPLKLPTTRSSFPSPLRSAADACLTSLPAGKLTGSVKVPSPFPANIKMLSGNPLVTKSGLLSELKSPTQIDPIAFG